MSEPNAKGLTLAELVRELPGAGTVEGDAAVRVTGVHHDSRRVERGDLFVVRKGEKFDGSAFVKQAVERGASAVLAETSAPLGDAASGVPIVRVADVPVSLAYAAAAVYGHPAFALDVIGVTGTNGKTTTTHLVRAAVDGAYGKPLCGIIGTVGHSFAGKKIEASHTTPEADELARVMATMRAQGATTVAMEVSSIALTSKRVAAVRFRVAAFTNLTQDHLDFHGSMEAYAAAKMELFTELAPGLAVVNVGDPFGDTIARAAKCRVARVTTSLDPAKQKSQKADVFPETVEASAAGMRIRARIGENVLDFETPLVGMHNVENLLVALGSCWVLDLELDRAAAALANELGAPGRLERVSTKDDEVVVLVDYAHTPDALGRVLDAIRSVAGGDGASGAPAVTCVFGCGGDRDPTKRAPMGEAVGKRADVAFVTSDNPRSEDPAAIAAPVQDGVRAGGRAALGGGPGRRAALRRAIAEAEPGDVVLVAGKGHEDYQIVGTEKRHFDDREEARAALDARRASRPAQR